MIPNASIKLLVKSLTKKRPVLRESKVLPVTRTSSLLNISLNFLSISILSCSPTFDLIFPTLHEILYLDPSFLYRELALS